MADVKSMDDKGSCGAILSTLQQPMLEDLRDVGRAHGLTEPLTTLESDCIFGDNYLELASTPEGQKTIDHHMRERGRDFFAQLAATPGTFEKTGTAGVSMRQAKTYLQNEANRRTHAVMLDSAKQADVRVHTVRDGETLESIALGYYGDARAWRDIQRANQETVVDGGKIFPGTQLVIPNVRVKQNG